MTILIFNGPPGSGKDQVCSYLKEKGYTQIEFKEQLFKDTLEHFDVDREWFFSGYDQVTKNLPEEKLGGLSRRQALIHVSEKVNKLLYGSDYYGFKAAQKMSPGIDYCISDGGFVEELSHIINKLGGDGIYIVRLYRDGSDYNGDSRKYIKFRSTKGIYICGNPTDTSIYEDQQFPDPVDLDGYVVHNNGSLEHLYESIDDIIIRTHNERKNSKKE